MTTELKIQYRKTDALIPYARNARTHSDEQIAQVAASIREFGFTNPILVDGEATIIAGHGRLLAAQRLGMDQVPTITLADMTEAQRRAYVITDNKLALNAGWDDELLALELGDLANMDIDIALIGFSQDELDDLTASMAPVEDGLTDPDDVPDVPDAPVSKTGNVWVLGKHRIMCGDSASISSIKKLMVGAMACMVITDPPYGVAYTGKTKDVLTIENDDVLPEELRKLCNSWFDGVDAVLKDGGYILATVPARPLHLIFAEDFFGRGWLRQIMVWNKDSMVLGHSEYHYKHEPILFGWKPGGKRIKNADRTKTTVWDFSRPKASREHPTMKPVEMWIYAINNHSQPGGLLYEPFSGSGTTIIAAEQTGRACYAMEISPQYVDVAVRRWQEFTGKAAILEATGKTFDETASMADEAA